MNVRQGWSLIALESVAFAIFFHCARIARELYVEIAAIEFNVTGDLLARFDEWHIRAREAFWTLAVLWLVAIALAISQHAKARNRHSMVWRIADQRFGRRVGIARRGPIGRLGI
jgi:hypothetical protein